MPTQTAEQQQAAFTAAGLTPIQQSGVRAGIGYAPPTSLTGRNLAPASPIQLPTPPAPTASPTTGTSAVIATNNATLNPPTDPALAAAQKAQSDQNSLFQQFLGSQTPPPSEASLYESTYGTTPAQAQAQQATAQTDLNTKNQAVKDAQARYNALNAQINGLDYQMNTVIPNQDQQNATGREITASALANTTASEQRAILLQKAPLQLQALTAQADLASAQGNATLAAGILKQANAHLDALFNAQIADATNQWTYQTNLTKSVYDYLTASEKAIADAQINAANQAHSDQQAALTRANTDANLALTNGQGDLAAKIMALDPKSPTYQADEAALKGQIVYKTTQLDNQYKQAQIDKIYSDMKKGSVNNTTPVQTPSGTINVPATLSPYVQTSYDGTLYADISSLSPTDKAKAAQVAVGAGIKPIVDAATGSKLNAISVSKENLANISDSLTNQNLLNNSELPAWQGGANSLASFFGNQDVKSFNAWRTAIINNVQALAGGAGSGLRINKAEIDAALENDLPVITGVGADNLASAQAKITKLNSQLDVWNKQLLGGGNTAATHNGITLPSSGSTYNGITLPH